MDKHMRNVLPLGHVGRRSWPGLVAFALVLASAVVPQSALAGAPSTPISQVPLTITIPQHPQVFIAIGNSESMDGTLSGAIMTGSGSLSGGNASLKDSSSPEKYDIPGGFAPPLDQGDDGRAPYTVSKDGKLYDNGASRLNVAKQGIKAILDAYMSNTDFALLDYNTSGLKRYTTSVYYLSPPEGFVFTNTKSGDNRYVDNPCYEYGSASASVKSNCTAIAKLFDATKLSDSKYMQVEASSDDPSINDILYANGFASVGVAYNGPTPADPYSHYSLSQYNSNLSDIQSKYSSSQPGNVVKQTYPTNAGYIPFSPQVMYVQRGFGYGASQSANTGHVEVAMTSAGQQPKQSDIDAAIAKFDAALEPETNATGTSEIKASGGQSTLAGLLAKVQSYASTVIGSGKGCDPKQYAILVTDGLPTMDKNGKNWPPLGSDAAKGYGVTATFNADGTVASTNDQALTDTIDQLKSLKKAGITTYIIGLGAGVDPTKNQAAADTLTAMAIAGGSNKYIAATTPDALVKGLNQILIAIQAGSLATSSAAVNSTGLNQNSVAYQASYTTSDKPYQDWTGDLKAFPIASANGTVDTDATPLWDAQSELDALVDGNGWDRKRLIATWNPEACREGDGKHHDGDGDHDNGHHHGWDCKDDKHCDHDEDEDHGGPKKCDHEDERVGAGVPFAWKDIDETQRDLLDGTDSLGKQRLDYLRGDASNEKRNDRSGDDEDHRHNAQFRNRSHVLGDIVDSNPIYIGAPSGAYSDASYLKFVRDESERPPMLYVGANDGMLHAFDPATGKEKFAFVPNAVYGHLNELTDPLYNSEHHFYVDASPQAGDVQFSDDSWHTILVSGEAAGGNSIFALDVTHPDKIDNEDDLASKVLWEFTDEDMGYTFSDPAIAKINADPGFAVFVGNGYNSTSGKSVLYAINPQTGDVIRKIDLCAAVPSACYDSTSKGLGGLLCIIFPNSCTVSKPNGLSSVVVGNVNGILGDPVNRVYAGDLQGNLWSVDVTDKDPAKWTVNLLFQARDPDGNPQPITKVPAITLNPNYPGTPGLMVYVGTGKLLDTGDLGNDQTQSMYGVLDDTPDKPYTRENLQVQVLTTVPPTMDGNQTSNDLRTVTNNCINWTGAATPPAGCPNDGESGHADWSTKVQKGWFIDLPAAGERAVTNPRIDSGGVVFTTYIPSVDLCSTGGKSFLMDVSYANGGPFALPQFDINDDYAIDNSDQLASEKGPSKNPVGMSMGNVYSAAPTIISANMGVAKRVKLITKSDQKIKTVVERGGTSARVGWWRALQ